MKPIRVALVVGQLGFGGTEKQVLGLATHFDPENVEPVVVCPSPRSEPVGEMLRDRGIVVRRGSPGNLANRIQSLSRILRSTRSDVVHSLGDPAGAWVAMANLGLGIPHVHSLRSGHPGLARRVLRAGARVRADLLTVNASHLRPWLSFTPVVFTPNGVEVPSEDDIRLTQSSHPSAVPPTILYVGRNHPAKDIPTLLRAMLLLADRCDSEGVLPRVVLVGPGLDYVRERLVARFHVHQVREIADPRPWMRESSLLVLSSAHEGTPNVVLEAMAMGLPVVATAVGGCVRCVVPGKSGLLVPRGDASGLAESMMWLLSNPAEARRMGRRGRALAREHFSWSQACHAMEQAYQRSLQAHVHRPRR